MNDTVTIGGQDVALSDIDFNSDSNRFSYNGTDVTNLLTVAQMKTFSGFDNDKFLLSKYAAHYSDTHGGAAPPPVGSTSTLVNFGEQLYNDPLAAPLGQVNKVLKNTVSALFSNPFTLLAVVAIGYVAFLYVRKAKILPI